MTQENSDPDGFDPKKTMEYLVNHSREMWKAEEVNSARLENRARLIQSLALALIAFAGLGVYRAGLYFTELTKNPDLVARSTAYWIQHIASFDLTQQESRSLLYITGICVTISPLIFAILCLFGCLANELRRGEDDFYYPLRPTRGEPSVPQPSWKEISIFYGIGKAIEICFNVILKKRRAHKFNFGMNELLAQYRNNYQWLRTRPVLRRFMTASHFLQLPEDATEDAWKFLHQTDALAAEVFRSTYLSSSALRRWNQRKIDEIRASETLLAQGILLLAMSAIFFVNFSALSAQIYPVELMLIIGTLFAAFCYWRYKRRDRLRREDFIKKATAAGYFDDGSSQTSEQGNLETSSNVQGS